MFANVDNMKSWGNLANGFEARRTTQIINPLSTGHNSPQFFILCVSKSAYSLHILKTC